MAKDIRRMSYEEISNLSMEEINALIATEDERKKRVRDADHVRMKQFDELMARLDQIDQKLERIFHLLGEEGYDI